MKNKLCIKSYTWDDYVNGISKMFGESARIASILGKYDLENYDYDLLQKKIEFLNKYCIYDFDQDDIYISSDYFYPFDITCASNCDFLMENYKGMFDATYPNGLYGGNTRVIDLEFTNEIDLNYLSVTFDNLAWSCYVYDTDKYQEVIDNAFCRAFKDFCSQYACLPYFDIDYARENLEYEEDGLDIYFTNEKEVLDTMQKIS